jgi:hypothetical protein
MATFPTTTQIGTTTWEASGGGITNHEVFAFTLQNTSQPGIGALVSNVTVLINPTRYNVTVSAVQEWSIAHVNQAITGNLESNGV